MGFSVFCFCHFWDPFFRFLHSKCSVFQFWDSVHFAVFPIFDIWFPVLLLKKQFLVFYYLLWIILVLLCSLCISKKWHWRALTMIGVDLSLLTTCTYSTVIHHIYSSWCWLWMKYVYCGWNATCSEMIYVLLYWTSQHIYYKPS